jgi:hypothetical protein
MEEAVKPTNLPQRCLARSMELDTEVGQLSDRADAVAQEFETARKKLNNQIATQRHEYPAVKQEFDRLSPIVPE